jgi:hypothetical protein
MKELLRGENTISLEAAVLKCPNAELYLYLFSAVHGHRQVLVLIKILRKIYGPLELVRYRFTKLLGSKLFFLRAW